VSKRIFKDWIPAFLDNVGIVEAPRLMLFWCAVSAVAGCLRKKVWMDFRRYQWTPNFFIILVAPPGIISKSSTADLAMDLLRKVPGIKFGPDIVTWPALVSAFAAASESYEYNEEWYPMSPITLIASELGNLINPHDKEQINLFINLWDGRRSLEKITKMSGNDLVESPWINMLGCTTPHWIADNMPAATVGGGFTSRCVFVYADRKENFVAYGDEAVHKDYEARKGDLIHDLEYIALNLCGEYKLSPEARAFGKVWYEELWSKKAEAISGDMLDGYVARKQTHMHKLAMVIAASQRDDLVISVEDLALANTMLTSTEKDINKVFARIGKSEESLHAEQFIQLVQKRGAVSYTEAYATIHAYFPNFKDFEGIVAGAIRAGFVTMQQKGNDFWFVYSGGVV
jgi:Protein of unknown function (DUF3987)